MGWTVQKLRELHTSVPANPLLAEPMFLSGYIERLGTGTSDMLRLCKEKGLKSPDFVQDDIFKIIIWRAEQTTGQVSGQVTGQVSGQVSNQVPEEIPIEIRKVIMVLSGEMKRSEIQEILQLKHREYFMNNYIKPALKKEYIEMKYPDKPEHPKQKYRLTKKGKQYLLFHIQKNVKIEKDIENNPVLKRLNKEELRGYEWIKTKEEVGSREYAEHFNYNYKKAQRHLIKMRKLELLTDNGKAKNSPNYKYVIANKNG